LILQEVEGVEVRCLVDNAIDVLLPSTDVARRPPIRDCFERPLMAEHGFAAVITLRVGDQRKRLLFDSGLSTTAATHNLAALGENLADCEVVVASHGHVDHAGGWLQVRSAMTRDHGIPLVVHPHAFWNRVMKFPDGRSVALPAPRRELLSPRYELREQQAPSHWLDDRVLVTGEIPRTNAFEQGIPSHYREMDGRLEPDPLIHDDQAIVVHVRNRGLVIVTGCAHAGIINTVDQAQQLAGVDQIYAVIGGMHLSGGLFEPLITRTVAELQRRDPTYLVPCHCTGFKAISQMMQAMPAKVLLNSVGTTYDL
jgi:7,8-dihydropterin-6-yl-methyl-4-(beta-D-ribofuranosyl)aminobenzene 5'-phosphate synthase